MTGTMSGDDLAVKHKIEGQPYQFIVNVKTGEARWVGPQGQWTGTMNCAESGS